MLTLSTIVGTTAHVRHFFVLRFLYSVVMETLMCDLARSLDFEGFIEGWSCLSDVPNVAICEWATVECDVSGRVAKFYLSDTVNVTVSGTLPTSVGQLLSLEALSITYSGLHGSIPTEIGDLHHAPRHQVNVC